MNATNTAQILKQLFSDIDKLIEKHKYGDKNEIGFVMDYEELKRRYLRNGM